MGGSYAGTAARQALEIDPVVGLAASSELPNLSSPARMEPVAESSAPASVADSDIERIKSALESRRKMFLVTALEGARCASLEAGELYIEFALEARHLRDTLAKTDNVKVLRDVCQEITGKECGVRIIIKDQAAADDAPCSKEDEELREKQRLRESAEKNPVVQQMLRTFRGEIADVRRVDGEG